VDALNRWPNRSVIFGGNTISKESYGYDKMNRLTTIDRTEDNKRDQFGYYLDGELNIAQYGLALPTPIIKRVKFGLLVFPTEDRT
jgi:hypothetical protein